ncbi:MAG: hypothetical protein HYY25_08760 [Candidatus Wallbacteria bacterium]|nr:hypothetical protein [Candidatus Wallbacteria bacterium]
MADRAVPFAGVLAGLLALSGLAEEPAAPSVAEPASPTRTASDSRTASEARTASVSGSVPLSGVPFGRPLADYLTAVRDPKTPRTLVEAARARLEAALARQLPRTGPSKTGSR